MNDQELSELKYKLFVIQESEAEDDNFSDVIKFEDESLESQFNFFIQRALYLHDIVSGYQVGRCFENGLGVKKDQNMAFQWFFWSAINGFKDAYYKLGLYYNYGKSVEQDFKKAQYWYQLAFSDGHENAAIRLAILYYILAQAFNSRDDVENSELYDWYINRCVNYLNGNITYRGYIDEKGDLNATGEIDYEDLDIRITDLKNELDIEDFDNSPQLIGKNKSLDLSSRVLSELPSQILDCSDESFDFKVCELNDNNQIGKFLPLNLEEAVMNLRLTSAISDLEEKASSEPIPSRSPSPKGILGDVFDCGTSKILIC